MRTDFHASDDRSIPPYRNGDVLACKRCSGRLDLLTVLPRRGDEPAYRILGCGDCSFVEWIADKVDGKVDG
jgi:hypothetical protein